MDISQLRVKQHHRIVPDRLSVILLRHDGCASVALNSMPCVHFASRDTTLAASTSNRCISSVPVQRVPQCRRTYKQLRRQLRRSHVAVQRAYSQLDPNRQQQTQQVEPLHTQLSAQHRPALTLGRQHQLGRCVVHGFTFAAFLTFLAPGPSYSAESLPVGLLKSWVVSLLKHSLWSTKYCLSQGSMNQQYIFLSRNKLRVLDQWLARFSLC